MSFASAEAPVSPPVTLASMTMVLRDLPRTALAPRAEAIPTAFAFAAPQPQPVRVRMEGHLVRIAAHGTEARVFVIDEPLSPERAAELRKAVDQAVAEGRKVKFRVDRRDGDGGGGGESVFDVNIQTLVKGE